MSKFTKKYILSDEITYLPVSDDFKMIADKMQLSTIRQILDMPDEVFRPRDFGPDFLTELSELGEEYGFLHDIERKFGF